MLRCFGTNPIHCARGSEPCYNTSTAEFLPSSGRGIDLLERLSRRSLLQRMAVVLNSSDSAIQELAAAESAACLVLKPKKVRPDDILRVVHARGPCQADEVVKLAHVVSTVDRIVRRSATASN